MTLGSPLNKSIRTLKAGNSTLAIGANGLLQQWTYRHASGEWPVFQPPDPRGSAIPHWPSGGCPVLFPWAGRCWWKDRLGDFSFDGRQGSTFIHGFAYRHPVSFADSTEDAVTLSLHTDGNDAFFPWRQTTRISYQCKGAQLAIQIETHNQDNAPMPIAPGIHPFFALGKLADWQVSIPAQASFAVTERGLAGVETAVQINGMSCDQPALRSVILGQLRSDSATLNCRRNGRRITVRWDSTKTHCVVLWVDGEAGYFCLEPWSALPDAVHHRLGLQVLAPGERATNRYEVELSVPS
jgi:galactose mutarotase-like enzyme